MNWPVLVLASLVASASASAQSHWSLHGGAAPVRLQGPVTRWLHGPAASAANLPAGDYAVHFGASAAGKPRSLRLAVPDGAMVCLATAAAGAPPPAASSAADADTNYRVVAIAPPGRTGAVGVVARASGDDHGYRFVWDRGAAEFRLERALGGPPQLLAGAVAPAGDEASHALALQVDGFRLTASWDEADVLHCLDGGLTAGGHGAWSVPPAARPAALARRPVARPLASAALVVGERAAHWSAAVTVVPGHWYVLELALAGAPPPLPLTPAGLEPWLLLPPAAPWLAWADWRGSLGEGGIGEVDHAGMAAASVQWPPLPGVRRQCMLVRALLVSADGGVVAGRTPGVPFCIP